MWRSDLGSPQEVQHSAANKAGTGTDGSRRCIPYYDNLCGTRVHSMPPEVYVSNAGRDSPKAQGHRNYDSLSVDDDTCNPMATSGLGIIVIGTT